MIGAKFKKTGHVTITTPIEGKSVIPVLAFDILYRHTKFGDSRFSCSGDMIVGIKIENRSCHLITPLLRVICNSCAGT